MRLLPNIPNIKGLLTDFLFPKSRRVLELEALTGQQILETLPRAEDLQEKHTLALFDYSHRVTKEIVWEVKYNGNRVLADKLGEILYDVIQDELGELSLSEKWGDLVLVPIPVSDKRRYERGWNQAELLCEAIKKCDVNKSFKYLPRQLAKMRHTESQTQTGSRSERLKNLEGSMKVIFEDSVRGKCAVVVDDVTTTGATFTEARRALKKAGAKKILCVAVAH